MGVPVLTRERDVEIREVGEGEIRRWRGQSVAGVVGWSAPVKGPAEPPPPLVDFRPARPEVVYRRMIDQLQGWARASKADWMVNVASFREQNGTTTAHMTDEQLAKMLHDKTERALKEAYAHHGRSRELQIKVGGF